MELSAIAKMYNVQLTRPERDLLSQLGTRSSNLSEDRYKQKMKELAAARELAKRLPDRKTSERQNKLEKAAMLKERLKVLRQMIPFLSPSAAKALRAEMRQIAAQIASLTDGSGGDSGSVTEATETPTPESSPSGSVAAPPQGAAALTDVTDEWLQKQQPASSDGAAQESAPKSTAGTMEDRHLKETVEEIRGLYKVVMAALKRKQQAARGIGPGLRVYATIPDTTGSVGVKV